MEHTIILENFEGPLNLLLNLIDKNKLDIYDIPISKLTDDYLIYINSSNYNNMNETSEFIYMASILLEIKSKMLLPKQKDENLEDIDPRDELMHKLIEYKRYKMVADELSKLDIFVNKVMFKEYDKALMSSLQISNTPTYDDLLNGVSLELLNNIFIDILKRKEQKIDHIRSGFRSITKPIYNIHNKIKYIKNLLKLNGSLSFYVILNESSSKTELIVTFLAILEIIKSNWARVYQDGTFNEIIITEEK